MTIENGLILVNSKPTASKDYIGNMMSALVAYSQDAMSKPDVFDQQILPQVNRTGKPLQLVSYDVMAVMLFQSNRGATVEELVQHINDSVAAAGEGTSVHLRAFGTNFILFDGMLVGGGIPIDELNDAVVEAISNQLRITTHRIEGFLMAVATLTSADGVQPELLATVGAVGCQTFGLQQMLKNPYMAHIGSEADKVVAVLLEGQKLSQQIREGLVAAAQGGQLKDLSVN